jgi:hypothetical protein
MWLSVLQQSTAETLLFKNATVWTNEKEGILEETDVLVKNGISAIGKIFQTLLLL